MTEKENAIIENIKAAREKNNEADAVRRKRFEAEPGFYEYKEPFYFNGWIYKGSIETAIKKVLFPSDRICRNHEQVKEAQAAYMKEDYEKVQKVIAGMERRNLITPSKSGKMYKANF